MSTLTNVDNSSLNLNVVRMAECIVTNSIANIDMHKKIRDNAAFHAALVTDLQMALNTVLFPFESKIIPCAVLISTSRKF